MQTHKPLSLFLSRFAVHVAQSLKEPNAGPQSSLFCMKFANSEQKIKAAILHFNDIMTVNCALCDLIAHLTFRMRKVSVTRNSSQTTRRSSDMDGWVAGHETRVLPLCNCFRYFDCTNQRVQCFGLKECQLAFMKRMTDIYVKWVLTWRLDYVLFSAFLVVSTLCAPS